MLPEGVITPGSQETLAQLQTIGLPEDLSGKTVLDVGCSDGFFSFECEKRGADRILAIDNHSSPYIDNSLGFQVAHELLHSKVEFMKADIFDLDTTRIGQFDLVLFLGVLYHLRHPLLALERVATLCAGQLIMETELAEHPRGKMARLFSTITGFKPPQSWMEFYTGAEINRDPTVWWAPTTMCAEAMLSSCGFCDVQTISAIYRRGVFHGFTPMFGDDAAQLVSDYGTQFVVQVCNQFLDRRIVSSEITSVLRNLSITDFGQIKQALAESRAKDWHQIKRWKPTS